jgi:hypothetical protein
MVRRLSWVTASTGKPLSGRFAESSEKYTIIAPGRAAVIMPFQARKKPHSREFALRALPFTLIDGT